MTGGGAAWWAAAVLSLRLAVQKTAVMTQQTRTDQNSQPGSKALGRVGETGPNVKAMGRLDLLWSSHRRPHDQDGWKISLTTCGGQDQQDALHRKSHVHRFLG